ncbi:hypothetical protein PO124_20620 [Bacillus licheniformis]|nr:hypothetical protein [Bacillus licheniformis]
MMTAFKDHELPGEKSTSIQRKAAKLLRKLSHLKGDGPALQRSSVRCSGKSGTAQTGRTTDDKNALS